ncbi:alpha/beta fold hydrolase [Nocardia concava]|uniref:alpha/beta fold hydrolase n=1 Tax=Nocardia concava TaxID=257281 RepID=UPI0002E54787|nr:alpha/beta hydrolase [Nocardia concava]
MTTIGLPEVNIGGRWKHKGIGHFRDEAGFERYRAAYLDGMAALPEPTLITDLPTTLGTVRAYRFGSATGRPLVLLPGRQAATPMWAANLPSLMALRPIITLDLLGEPGMSVQRAEIADAADQASWLDESLYGLGLDRVHVLGVSIGGWSAVNLAIHSPRHAASLTLLDAPMVFGPVSWKMIAVSMGSVLPGMPQRWRDALLSWISGGVEAPRDLPEGRLIASGMRDFHATLPMTKIPAESDLAAIDIPVLAIFAGRSIVHNPDRMADRARTLLSDSRVEVWPDATHALNGEFPQRIADRVAAFLAEVE